MRESENKTKAIINLEKARDMLYDMLIDVSKTLYKIVRWG